MSRRELQVLAVGNAIVDVIAQADDDLLVRNGLAKGSMRLVDDAEARALYEQMGPAVEVSGGSAANTAVGVASFGGRAGFVGRVADDVVGEVFTHDIRAAGVRFESPPRSGGDLGSGRCLVLVTPDAQRTMSTSLGVAGSIEAIDVPPGLVGSSDVLYCEGYLWDSPVARATMVSAMDEAAAAGTRVAFTLSDAFCVDRHREDFLALAEGRVDVLFANEAELMSLYQVDRWEEAAEAVAGHCEVACLTRSEHGSVVVSADGERRHVEAQRFGPVVDTTGAGDLYAAGFLYGLTSGLELGDCARLGSLAAGEVISHVGARPARPLAELVELPLAGS